MVMGMCLIDIFSSIGLGANVTVAPSYMRNEVYPAYGNEVTCKIQGFLVTLGLCVPIYSCFLCLYYMFYIRYEVREDIFKKYEKYMHLTALSPPLSLGIVALVCNLYKSSGQTICFILPVRKASEFPDYDKRIIKIVNILIAVGFVLIFIIIFGSMVAVYQTVRKQESTMEQYETFHRPVRRISTINGIVRNDRNHRDDTTNTTTGRSTHQETFVQSCLYVGGFLFTYLPVFIMRFIRTTTSFPCNMMVAFFVPLQGFWIFLTFIRPKFVALRNKNKRKPCLWILYAVVFSSLEEEERKKRRMSAVFDRNLHVERQATNHLIDITSSAPQQSLPNNLDKCDNDGGKITFPLPQQDEASNSFDLEENAGDGIDDRSTSNEKPVSSQTVNDNCFHHSTNESLHVFHKANNN